MITYIVRIPGPRNIESVIQHESNIAVLSNDDWKRLCSEIREVIKPFDYCIARVYELPDGRTERHMGRINRIY